MGRPSGELGNSKCRSYFSCGNPDFNPAGRLYRKTWARAAEVIMVDIDPAELKSLPCMWRCQYGLMRGIFLPD